MVRMRLLTARATYLSAQYEGDIIQVAEKEARRLEEGGVAERVEELEKAAVSASAERPEKKRRGRPRRQA